MAINLPVEVTMEIGQLQLRIDKLKLPINWDLPHKIHMTLNFMGHLEDADIVKVRQIVKQVATGYNPFTLRPVAVDALYIRHEQSVVYLLAQDMDERLGDLQKELTVNLDKLTPQPRQKFLPHITIGRIRKADPTFVKQTIDKLSQVEIDPLSQFAVEKIDVMESLVSKAGSSYQKLGSFTLGNKETVLTEVS